MERSCAHPAPLLFECVGGVFREIVLHNQGRALRAPKTQLWRTYAEQLLFCRLDVHKQMIAYCVKTASGENRPGGKGASDTGSAG